MPCCTGAVADPERLPEQWRGKQPSLARFADRRPCLTLICSAICHSRQIASVAYSTCKQAPTKPFTSPPVPATMGGRIPRRSRMSSFQPQPPSGGEKITIANGRLEVPDHPVIPFIEGDGTGPDIWRASVRVLDATVQKEFGGKKKIAWAKVYAGEKAKNLFDSWLPDETLEAFKTYFVGIKGPLTTPVGDGIRSLNVAIRQMLDLYVCLRPVQYFKGVPSPVKAPEKVNMVIFRENTEDIYAGIEWAAESPEAKKVIAFLRTEMGVKNIRFPETSGIGIKPVSREGSERLIRAALDYAIRHKRKSVTLVHKGNIMKFTEGAFRDWGYALVKREYAGRAIGWDDCGGKPPAGQILVKDSIADITLQQVLTRPEDFDVIATLNLNGD